MQDIDHWLALHTVDGIGPTLFRRLLDRFGSPREAFLERSSSALLAIGLSSHSIEQTHRFSDLQRQVAKDLQWLSDPNHHLLTIQDSNYPVLLKEIPQPPPLLFIKGDPDCMSKLQIAMVGSRNPTGAGRDTATAFARSLSKADVVVTSGMAAGIDAASHHGALQGPAPSIAVLGTGADQVYPARHRKLARQIAASGALISEFPLGTGAMAQNFPRRNRIISGLSLGVLVVEANIKSGSLITAGYAAEQNREVFAIPGSIHSPLSKGCHQLLRQGAKLVESMEDVLEELGSLAEFQLFSDASLAQSLRDEPVGHSGVRTGTGSGIQHTGNLSPIEERVVQQMDFQPLAIDVMVAKSGIAAEQLAATLIQLELKNIVRIEAGGYALIPTAMRADT